MKQSKTRFHSIHASLLAVCVLVTGCTINHGNSVNGQGFGGDPRAVALMQESRDRVLAFVKDAGTTAALNRLGKYDGCFPEDDPSVCETVKNLTDPQRDDIRAFFSGTRIFFLAQNGATPLTIITSPSPLTVPDPDNPKTPREVDGRTQVGVIGSPLEFGEPFVFAASPMTRAAVTYHEEGHQLQFLGAFLTDYKPTKSYPVKWGGQKFLDAAGDTVAYASYHKRSATIAVGTGPNQAIQLRAISPLNNFDFLNFGVADLGETGARVALGDVNGDGIPDLIMTTGPGATETLIRVYDGATGVKISEFAAIPSPGWRGGAFVAAGDIDGDGKADVVVSADGGGGPAVMVYSLADPAKPACLYYFMAYDVSFTGGVRVAAGDVNGDGQVDIITAPGPGMEAEIRIFDGSRAKATLAVPVLMTSFKTYGAWSGGIAFGGGAFVAAGDVNGDGKADIITGADAGGGADVRVFEKAAAGSNEFAFNFLAFDGAVSGGVRVAAADIDGDGKADIIVGGGAGSNEIRLYSGITGAMLPGTAGSFTAFPHAATGVYVAGYR